MKILDAMSGDMLEVGVRYEWPQTTHLLNKHKQHSVRWLRIETVDRGLLNARLVIFNGYGRHELTLPIYYFHPASFLQPCVIIPS